MGKIGKRWASGNWLRFVRGAVFAQPPREQSVHPGAGLPQAGLSGHGSTASPPHPAPCRLEREGEGTLQSRLLVGSCIPFFWCLRPLRAAQGAIGLGCCKQDSWGTHGPPSLLGTDDLHSPIKEMKVKEKEAGDSLLFPCKRRAGRQP